MLVTGTADASEITRRIAYATCGQVLLVKEPGELINAEQEREQQRDQHGTLDQRRSLIVSQDCFWPSCHRRSSLADVITDRAEPSQNCRRPRASPVRRAPHRDRFAIAAEATSERASQTLRSAHSTGCRRRGQGSGN